MIFDWSALNNGSKASVHYQPTVNNYYIERKKPEIKFHNISEEKKKRRNVEICFFYF